MDHTKCPHHSGCSYPPNSDTNIIVVKTTQRDKCRVGPIGPVGPTGPAGESGNNGVYKFSASNSGEFKVDNDGRFRSWKLLTDNPTGHFDIDNGTYTVPVDGIYNFYGQITFNGLTESISNKYIMLLMAPLASYPEMLATSVIDTDRTSITVNLSSLGPITSGSKVYLCISNTMIWSGCPEYPDGYSAFTFCYPIRSFSSIFYGYKVSDL